MTEAPAFSVRCADRILVATFARTHLALSWSLTRPGFTQIRHVAWLHVRDDELSVDRDPAVLLEERMAAAGLQDAVHLMTSRDVRQHHMARACVGNATATCLATVGLGNAVRIGAPPHRCRGAGTINILVHVDRPLSAAALIETISIAAQARTVAIVDLAWKPQGEVVTGTGTDCIVVASPADAPAEQFAGLHTDVGVAVGRAVHQAVARGGKVWIGEQELKRQGMG